MEVRGVRIGRSSFKRRTFVTYLVGLSYLETANAKPQEIRRQITQANETEKHIFVTSDRTVYSDSLQVIDLDQNELVKIGVTFRDALKATRPVSSPLISSNKLKKRHPILWFGNRYALVHY